MNRILFIIGLIVSGIAAVSLLLGAIQSGVAALIGIAGIGLIGSSAAVFTPDRSLKERKRV